MEGCDLVLMPHARFAVKKLTKKDGISDVKLTHLSDADTICGLDKYGTH